MREHRLFAPLQLRVGDQIALGEKATHYLSKVLRLREGTEIVLFNGDGKDYRCKLTGFGRQQVAAQVLECTPNAAESPLRVTLVQALSRGERMDYCLQKATELGVSAVQLLLSERVELKLAGSRLEKRMAHWRGVVESACEQSGRARLPELLPPLGIETWLDGSGQEVVMQRLVLDAGAVMTLGQLKPCQSFELAVGPEGGFTDAELSLMGSSGVVGVRLGPRTLRTETAGPAALAVLQSMFGDWA